MSRSLEEIKEDIAFVEEKILVKGETTQSMAWYNRLCNERNEASERAGFNRTVENLTSPSLGDKLNKMTPIVTELLLEERGKSHGDFKSNSLVSQKIKYAAKLGVSYGDLEPFQKEALDMIIHKIARIVSGDPNFNDHWDDIAGYSTLVSKELTKNKSTLTVEK